MVIFSAIAAVIGAVVGGIGAAAAGIGAGVAALGAATGLGAAGLAVGAASLGVAAYGAYSQYQASKQMASAQKKAEALQKQQTQLEVNNSAIDTIRQAQLVRSQNLVRGTAQLGSGAPFGSALANSSSSVESALGYQLDTTGQAGSIGFGIFNANAQYSDASSARSIASGISSLGQVGLSNLAPIERVGNYLTGGAFQNWGSSTSVSRA